MTEHHALIEHFAASAAIAVGALLPIVNPLGAVPVFHTLTGSAPADHRRREARLAALATFVGLVVFMLAGRLLLGFFGISLGALEIAGGLVVGFSGMRMVLGMEAADEDGADAGRAASRSVAITPMTMPLLAGPGALGVVLGFSARHDSWLDYVGFVVGIAAVALVVLVALRFGDRPLRRLGPGGVDATMRIFGLIVVAVAVELMLHGFAEHVD